MYVSGDPGAGKSRDVPPSVLGTLMEQDEHCQYEIALILELKVAQNVVHEHMQQEHQHIASKISIWNGNLNGHVWPQFESFLVLCS